MRFIVAFVAVLAVASAQFGFSTPAPRYVVRPTIPAPRAPVVSVSRVATNDQAANTLRYDNDIGPDGSYTYVVETDNGISAQAQGVPRVFSGNPPAAPVVASGSFAWTSPEGRVIAISYIADENGYQPSGDAIPTPHPIPEAIARSIEYNLRNQK